MPQIDRVGRKIMSSAPDSIMEEMSELLNKAMGLLPDSEWRMARKLQSKYLASGYQSMSKDEIATMTRLNEKATELLPERDRTRLRLLFKLLSEEAVDSLRH
jgi:hypothetical protein